MSFQDLYGAGAFGGGPPAMAGPPASSTDTAGPGIAALLAKARGAVGSLLPPSPFASFAPPANATPSGAAAPGAPPTMPPAPAPQSAAPVAPGAGFTPPMPQPRPPGATPAPPGAAGMPMSLAPPNPGPGTPNPGTMNPGMLQNFLQMLKQGQTPQAAPGAPSGQGGQAPGAPQGGQSQGLFPKMFNDGSNLYKAFSAAGAPAAAAGGTSSAAFTGALAGLF